MQDFFDQSLDEIKILKYLNAHDTRDDHHLLQLYDYFYFKVRAFSSPLPIPLCSSTAPFGLTLASECPLAT